MPRWNSIRRSETTCFRVSPSNVAALMMRLRSSTGPSRAGANGSGDSARPPQLLDAIGVGAEPFTEDLVRVLTGMRRRTRHRARGATEPRSGCGLHDAVQLEERL